MVRWWTSPRSCCDISSARSCIPCGILLAAPLLAGGYHPVQIDGRSCWYSNACAFTGEAREYKYAHCILITIHDIQLPGNVDGEVLCCGLRVVCYFDELVPMYKISVPGQSLAIVDPSPVVHMSAPGEDGGNGDEFYEMVIPAVVLERLRPDLSQGSVRPSCQPSLMDEDVGSPPFDSVAVNLVALIPEARVIDLTDDEDAQCFETEVIDLTSD